MPPATYGQRVVAWNLNSLCDIECAAIACELSGAWRFLFINQCWVFVKRVVETLTSVPIIRITQKTPWKAWQSA